MFSLLILLCLIQSLFHYDQATILYQMAAIPATTTGLRRLTHVLRGTPFMITTTPCHSYSIRSVPSIALNWYRRLTNNGLGGMGMGMGMGIGMGGSVNGSSFIDSKLATSSSSEVKASPSVVSTKGQYDYDVIIAGGGAAGLSAALVLGRARRRVLLIDEGDQCNISADKIGGLLGQIKTSPTELYTVSHQQLTEFPTVIVRRSTSITKAVQAADHITVTAIAKGVEAPVEITTRRLILAMGLHWQYNEALPNAKLLWGKSVFHCPFCHAWEYKDEPMAVLNNTPHGTLTTPLSLR
jgi:hypothetical protein